MIAALRFVAALAAVGALGLFTLVLALVRVARFVLALILSPHPDWPMVLVCIAVIVLWQMGLI